MKTKIANECSDWIIEQMNQHRNTAKCFASLYAESDNKEYQENFKKASAIADELQNVHKVVCQSLWAIEELIPEDVKKQNE